MNKKGFTLVELLAVVVLLGIIGYFALSTIVEKVEENRKTVDSATEKVIRAAVQQYMNSYSNRIERKNGNIYCFELSEVLSLSNMEDINPNTKQKLTDEKSKIKVTFLEENFEMDLTNNCTSNVDPISNVPNLKSNMVPIKFDANNNILKADPDKFGDWYNYSEKKWANAMIVSPIRLAEYKALKSGELIVPFNEKITDVIFVVWIPKFSYTTGTSLTNVTFVSGSDVNETLHPAFNNIDGFWISKFELTYNTEISSTYEFNAYTNSKSNLENLITNIKTNSDYNFVKDSIVTMESNNEYEATAYLANSKYGKGTDFNIASTKTGFRNGYDTGYYHSSNGLTTSSTGNITGVFGLSGGANEWVLNGSNCTTRGGGTSNGSLFASSNQTCTNNYSTRITIK